MLRFQIFGFPVSVHWMFWLITALLGGADRASSPVALKLLVIWVAAVFVSVLWHELGHALMMRRFGERRAEIHLYGGGGLAIGSGFRTRHEQILISAAGPAAGLALGLVVWLVSRAFPPMSIYADRALSYLLIINVFWSLVNLLPIIPLDGGRITEAALAGKGRLALRISLVCAVAVALYAFTRMGSLFMALMFVVMAMDNWRTLNGRPASGWMGQ